jgi:hypothetical protein
MKKPEKRQYLDQIAAEQLPEVVEQLLGAIPAPHPAYKRVSDLAGRLRELNERIAMGTLSKEDVGRVRARIGGGLRDVVQEYKPMPVEADKEVKQETFQLNLKPVETAPVSPTEDMGFRGEVVYQGSPSKKTRSIELVKGYGAAFHQVTQAIRKAGMTMESADRAGGRLSASLSPTSSAKFGEVVEVWVKPSKNGRTWVEVVVDSASPTTMMDFGRHASKLNLIFSYLG